MENSELLTPTEAGQVFGIGAFAIKKRIRLGQLEGCRIGGRKWAVPKKAVQDALQRQIDAAQCMMQKAA